MKKSNSFLTIIAALVAIPVALTLVTFDSYNLSHTRHIQHAHLSHLGNKSIAPANQV
jgi:hypothetical protein